MEHSRGDRRDVLFSTAIVMRFQRVTGRLRREESQPGCHSVDDALHTDLVMPCTVHDFSLSSLLSMLHTCSNSTLIDRIGVAFRMQTDKDSLHRCMQCPYLAEQTQHRNTAVYRAKGSRSAMKSGSLGPSRPLDPPLSLSQAGGFTCGCCSRLHPGLYISVAQAQPVLLKLHQVQAKARVSAQPVQRDGKEQP